MDHQQLHRQEATLTKIQIMTEVGQGSVRRGAPVGAIVHGSRPTSVLGDVILGHIDRGK